MAYRYFSERVLRWIVPCLIVGLGSCVTVRPDEKEYLANPAMTFGSGGESTAQEEHMLHNREGSFGAGGVSGGGCGCN